LMQPLATATPGENAIVRAKSEAARVLFMSRPLRFLPLSATAGRQGLI
jgi:hypothetical protein